MTNVNISVETRRRRENKENNQKRYHKFSNKVC